MADLQGFKTYAVACGDLTDGELQLFLDAAKEYFKNAGVPETTSSALYDLGVYRLATYYADNRGPSPTGGGADPIHYGIQGIIIQLKDCGVN